MFKYAPMVIGAAIFALSFNCSAEINNNAEKMDSPAEFQAEKPYPDFGWNLPFDDEPDYWPGPRNYGFPPEGATGFIPPARFKPSYPAFPRMRSFNGPAPYMPPQQYWNGPQITPRMAQPVEPQIPENQAQIGVLRNHLLEMERQLEVLHAENHQLRMNLESAASTQPGADSLQAELSLMQASMAALTAERDQLLSRSQALSAEHEQAQASLTSLQAEFEKFRQQQASTEQNMSQHTQMLQQLESERNQLQQALAEALEQAKAGQNESTTERQTLANEITSLENDMQELESIHRQLLEDHNTLKNQRSEESAILEQAQASLASNDENFNAERQTMKNHISGLTQQLEALQGGHGELLQAYENMKLQQGDQAATAEQAQSKLAEMEQGYQSERQAMLEDIARYQQQLEQLNTQGNQQQAQFAETEQGYQSERQEMLERIAGLEQQLEQLTAQNSQLQTQYAETEQGFQSESQSMQEEITQLQQQLEQLAAQASQQEAMLSENQGHEEEISQLKQALAERNDELGGLSMRLNNTESIMTGLKAASNNARNKLASMGDEYQLMQEQLTQAQEKQAAADQVLQAKDAEVVELQQQLESRVAEQTEMTQQLQANLQSNQQQESQTAALQKELDQARSEYALITESLAKAEATLQQQATGLQELEAARATISSCQTDLDNNMQMIAKLNKQIKTLETDLESSRTAQADMKKLTSDTDGDGISDAMDICPDTTTGVDVNAKGCEPDDDLDGLVNRLDLCPDSANGSSVDELGCNTEQTITLEGVNFQSSSADFTTESLAVLDGVAAILTRFENLMVEVAGHTDNTGPREFNIDLSATRANAVKDYLVGQGVASDRLTAYGYGPDQPVASNAGAEGRALNRRVELRRK